MRLLLPVAVSVVVLIACPRASDVPPPPPAPPHAATVQLSAPLAVRVGEPTTLGLTVGGDATGATLKLIAFRPGAAVVPKANRWLQTGLAPPTGGIRYVSSFRALQETEVVYSDAPASGPITLMLDATGEWLFVAELTNANGLVVSAAASTAVAAAIGVRLSVSQLLANTDDHIRVRATLIPGAAARDVELVAWLQTQAGAALPLPRPERGVQPAFRGMLDAPLEVPLLDRALDAWGPGTVQLHALLFDRATNELLAMASAGIEVCDEEGTVSGAVTVGGAPLPFSAVTATSMSGGEHFALTADDLGRYTVQLRPGNYLLRAGGGELTPATVECGGSTTLDLKGVGLRSSSQGLGSTRRQATMHAPQGEAEYDGRPKPLLLVSTTVDFGDPDAGVASLLDGMVAAELPVTDYDARTRQEITALGALYALSMLIGGNPSAELIEAARNVNAEFILGCFVDHSGSFGQVTVTLWDVEAAQAVGSKQGSFTWPDEQAMGDLARALTDQLRTQPIGEDSNLMEAIRRRQGWPKNPVLKLDVTPKVVEPNGTIHASLLLTEKTDGRAEPRRPVAISSAYALDLVGSTDFETDSSGRVETDLVVGSTPGLWQVSAAYSRRGADGGEYANELIEVKPKSDVEVEPAKQVIAEEEVVAVTITVADAGFGVPVQLTSDGGTLSQATAVTANGGLAVVSYTAGTKPGLYPIVAAVSPVLPGIGFVLIRPGKAGAGSGGGGGGSSSGSTRLNAYGDPTEDVPNDTSTTIVADVRVANGSWSGLPVRYSLTGLGRLSAGTGVTDASGLARVTYTAPMTGEGTDDVTVSVNVAGQVLTQKVSINYRVACATCPVIITGPANVAKGASQQYTANQPVVWSISDPSLGSIDRKGKFTAGHPGGLLKIEARAVADMNKKGEREITIDCDRSDLAGTYDAVLSWTGPGQAGCTQSPTAPLKLGSYPGGGANELSVDLSYAPHPTIPNATCTLGTFQQPPFARISGCSIDWAQNPGCTILTVNLRPEGSLKKMVGTFRFRDFNAPGCPLYFTVDVTATR